MRHSLPFCQSYLRYIISKVLCPHHMARPSNQRQLSLAHHSDDTLAQPNVSEHPLSSPSLVPSPLALQSPGAPPSYSFRCTGCTETSSSPFFAVGKRSRAVCRKCRRWLWNVSICWSCGDVVFQKTDAVGFGWCWWHWNCFSCLVCSVSSIEPGSGLTLTEKFPLRPPYYFNSKNRPHENGIMLMEPPVCHRCVESPDTITKLEQHAPVLNGPEKSRQRGSANKAASTSAPTAAQASNTSAILQCLVDEQDMRPQKLSQDHQAQRSLPAWMSLLPSKVNPHVRPPTQTIISRRLSFPPYSSSSNPIPYMTPLEWPISHGNCASGHLQKPLSLPLDKDNSPESPEHQKRHGGAGLAKLHGQTERLPSSRRTIYPESVLPQPAGEDPIIEDVSATAFSVLDSIDFSKSNPFQQPLPSFPRRRVCSNDPYATSSVVNIRCTQRTADASTQRLLPSKNPDSSFQPPSSRHARGRDPGPSFPEARIPSLDAPNASSTIKYHIPPASPETLARETPHSKAAPTPLLNKSPFLKELSSFFASRNSRARMILPSRVAQSRAEW